ncbi:unnamed protein product [Phytophthora fragariaefolia]|uniref:Unnamed protein product n=1 Tax=Phytophthora fragariaefolia TaxID=1490495 RepID=A0A9W6Y2I4_9STRA|nr:unnamed protein product [Phytophthora fragariaefolia]
MQDAALEQRWGFLAPWCSVLQYRVSCRALGDAPGRALHVLLPRRAGVYGELKDERTFQIEFQNTREALSLLAAVAYVDHTAWQFLLVKYCGVARGDEMFDSKCSVRYFLPVEPGAEADLIQLCGVGQRRYVSAGYVNTLARIAELGGVEGKNVDGVDLEIPVRAIFNATPKVTNKMTIEPIHHLVNIQAAEKIIREEWESYNWSLENQPVDAGVVRCTLVLEPMVADLRGLGCGNDIAETMARFVGENVWFSRLSLKAEKSFQGNHDTAQMSFRQMMAVVFDATRRSRELANTKYCAQMFERSRDADPLQMGTVSLYCDPTLGMPEYAAMFSALVLNQTTRHLTIHMRMNSNNNTHYEDWWKWAAYAFFSKRAQVCSALESLEIAEIGDIDVESMKALSAVLATEHPEEALCSSRRGLVSERDASLKQGSPVQWKKPEHGQALLDSCVVKFGSAIPYVLTFGDDGKSQWVNALIPGFGHCMVQRSDLVFHPARKSSPTSRNLSSLTIRFGDFAQPSLNGLPLLLSACGGSMRSLTIQSPTGEVDVNVVLQYCPNLRELTLQQGCVTLHLDVTEIRSSKQQVPKISLNWEDLTVLANALSNPKNLLTRCVRRLTIRLAGMNHMGNTRWARYGSVLAPYLNKLLEMLLVNDYLEYFKITVPSQCHEYAGYFQKHHNKLIRRGGSLSVNIKAALLSVLMTRFKATPLKKGRKTRKTRRTRKKKAQSQSAISAITNHVFAEICAFATSPIPRQVYFQQEYSENTPPELC